MSTIIDHAILIPATVSDVWAILKNPETTPNWQVGVKDVVFLNSLRSSKGMRWRSIRKSGPERVIDVTAWYEGLGYEFTVVDGLPGENRSRIRLQEIAEGTVVQWTLSYETRGFLGNLRSALSLKRQLDNEVVQSLRQLYTYVKNNAEATPIDIRSVMQDAPDVEERSRYTPRYPTSTSKEEENQEEIALQQELDNASMPISQAVSIFEEPPVSDEDTHPNPTLSENIDQPTHVEQEKAPAEISEASFETAFEKPEEPETLTETTTESPVEDIKPAETPEPLVEQTSAVDSEPASPEMAETRATQETTISEKSEDVDSITQPIPERTEPPEVPFVPGVTDEEPSIYDTARISVFDLFGIPKPSETQEMQAVRDRAESNELPVLPPVTAEPRDRTVLPAIAISEDDDDAEVEDSVIEEAVIETSAEAETSETASVIDFEQTIFRVGLRTRLRRQKARLRYPGKL